MIEFFLKRSAFTNLISFILIGMGLYQYLTVKRDVFPDVTFDIVTITTVYPGASSEEVDQNVTDPIEDAIRGVSGVDRVESFSATGLSAIVVRLDEGLGRRKVDRAVTDLQNAVSRVQGLPAEAKEPLVEEMTHDRPLIALSVAGADPETRKKAAEELRDSLEGLPGISRVLMVGDHDREILIDADPGLLAAAQVSVGELARAVQARNVNISAGVARDGDREVQLRTFGGLSTAEDVAAVIVRGNDERGFVRVRDVAKVRESVEDERLWVRVNGKPAITLQVMKHKNGDALHVADGVREVQKRLDPSFKAKGLDIVESDDFSFFVRRRLGVMKNNMLQGGVLIMGALFLFLDWRLAVVAALGVPISLAVALMVAVPFGVTINLLSVLAFIIVLGMLDDDSVVVAENIYRHMEMGKSPYQAALDGTREVLVPVLAGVLTSSSAFLPFAMISGIMGKFLIAFPIIIILCFLASLLEAFFILPAHTMDLMKYGKPVKEGDGRWYRPLIGRYERALAWSLDHRGRFALILAGVLAGTIAIAVLRLRVVMFPPGLIDQYFVQIEMAPGTHISATSRALERLERGIAAIPPEELDATTSTVGLSGYEETVRRGTHLAQSHLFLKPQEFRKRQSEDIINELRVRVGEIPGVLKLVYEPLRPGPPVGKAVQVRIRGSDLAVLKEIAGEYKAFLSKKPGVEDIRDSFEEDKPQIMILPRPMDLAFARLDFSAAGLPVASAAQGFEATRLRRGAEEVVVKVRVRGRGEGMTPLEGLLVPNAQQRPVPLGQVTRSEEGKTAVVLSRYNHLRTITVTAGVDNLKANSFEVNGALKEAFKDMEMRHPGYEAIYGGEEEETQKSFKSLFRAFAVALFLDLAILVAIFGSYKQALIITLTIPIGLLGVTFALIVHGMPISFMAMLGVVAMTGVVVNNAIIFMDSVNRERASGKAMRLALLTAGASRVRPILASGVTTLLGLFPTAYGWGGREPFVQPIALTMAWGLTFAMPLTLFIIPIAYSLAEDLKGSLARSGKAE